MKQNAAAFGPALLAGMAASAIGLPDSGVLLVVVVTFVTVSTASIIVILMSARVKIMRSNAYSVDESSMHWRSNRSLNVTEAGLSARSRFDD